MSSATGSRRARTSRASGRRILITGGAGFVGTNLAHRFASRGDLVTVFDDLSRRGVQRNLRWLTDRHGDDLRVQVASVLDEAAVREAAADADLVFHLAAQVAVTTSVVRPVEDFEVNARGTLNVLEAVRASPRAQGLVFTSTNKVYGSLDDIDLDGEGLRWEPRDPRWREGVSEGRPLEFRSPYGCSKGAADQYVLDYARIYGLRTVVLRMSCIYGPHQHGTEDQGWVAHFLIRHLEGRPITIYGDGRQVRDILHVDDLSNAFELAAERLDDLSGDAFNLGGGPERSTSLLEIVERMRGFGGGPVDVAFEAWRAGDQRWYVSDTTRFRDRTGWTPSVGMDQGLHALRRWLADHRDEAAADLAAATG